MTSRELVRGSASVVDDPAEVSALVDLHLPSWVADHSNQWVMISTDLVSGRRTLSRDRSVVATCHH